MSLGKGKLDFFDDLLHGYFVILPESGELPDVHLDRPTSTQQLFQWIDGDTDLNPTTKEFLKGHVNIPKDVDKMDVFLDNTVLVQELANREAQKIFGDAAPEVLMTHTSLRFTSDSYDQGCFSRNRSMVLRNCRIEESNY